MNVKAEINMKSIAYFMSAKQMRKLSKDINKKQSKQKEEANPKVIYDILKMLKNSDLCLKNRFLLVYGDEYGNLIDAVFNNFNAYKKAFRELGYKLAYQSNCSGSGFSISF